MIAQNVQSPPLGAIHLWRSHGGEGISCMRTARQKIRTHWRGWTYPQSSHAGRHIRLYRQFRVKDLPKVLRGGFRQRSWRFCRQNLVFGRNKELKFFVNINYKSASGLTVALCRSQARIKLEGWWLKVPISPSWKIDYINPMAREEE